MSSALIAKASGYNMPLPQTYLAVHPREGTSYPMLWADITELSTVKKLQSRLQDWLSACESV